MSELKIKGKITSKLDVEKGTSKAGKEWSKQNFILDTGEQYNPEVCFALFGEEKIEMLNKHSEGAEVTVSFNVSSREFNSKYYHNLDAWKIKAEGEF
tara:strand:- start:504 stop:794 length:291 start_codon:yes stop_codon:yes gene_type:complete